MHDIFLGGRGLRKVVPSLARCGHAACGRMPHAQHGMVRYGRQRRAHAMACEASVHKGRGPSGLVVLQWAKNTKLSWIAAENLFCFCSVDSVESSKGTLGATTVVIPPNPQEISFNSAKCF
jgi:hypothetical protein